VDIKDRNCDEEIHINLLNYSNGKSKIHHMLVLVVQGIMDKIVP